MPHCCAGVACSGTVSDTITIVSAAVITVTNVITVASAANVAGVVAIVAVASDGVGPWPAQGARLTGPVTGLLKQKRPIDLIGFEWV